MESVERYSVTLKEGGVSKVYLMLPRIFNPQNVDRTRSIVVRVFVLVLAIGFIAVFMFQVGCGAQTEVGVVSCNHPANAEASMMTPQMMSHKDGMERGDTAVLSQAGKDTLTTMLDAYFAIGDELGFDSIEHVDTQANEMLDAFHTLEKAAPAELWESHKDPKQAVRDNGHKLAETSNIKTARTVYGSLSEAVNHLTAAMGAPTSDGKAIYKYICGMASYVTHGSIWLQRDIPVRNPYFGRSMLRCHSDAKKVPAAVTEQPSGETPE